MILFNDPFVSGDEVQNIGKVFESRYFCGNGAFMRDCESTLREMFGAPCALLTSSCTAALEIAAKMLELAPGDEVILPSFTHVGTATAFSGQGAKIVWCDILPDTKNIDHTRLESLMTARTRAVVVVHYSGVACDMRRIGEICERRGVMLIEDNAAGIDAKCGDTRLGTFGALSTLSFHQTKNIQCGEGGALIINHPDLASKAVMMRDRGTNRRAFDEKKVCRYTWFSPGSNYFMSEMQAAFLKAQLDALPQVTAHRRALLARYIENLWNFLPHDRLPGIPAYAAPNGHAMYIMCESASQLERLIAGLRSKGVQSVFHYQPLHNAPYWNGAYDDVALPVTGRVAERILRLPMHYNLTLPEVDYICEQVIAFDL